MENHFHFTFRQTSGKWKALEDGPWVLSKELLVLADFDGSRALDEIEFSFILIRVTKLPMGLMNKAQTMGCLS